RGASVPAGRRILQVVQADPGGAPQHVLQLSRGLAERGFAVDVAADPRSGVDEQLRSIGLTVALLPASGRRPGPGDLRVGRFLRALARSNRYDVVHAHSSKSGAIARAFLGRSLPVVYTPHCFSFAAGFSGPERLAYRAV